jgi:hypothetical protein
MWKGKEGEGGEGLLGASSSILNACRLLLVLMLPSFLVSRHTRFLL